MAITREQFAIINFGYISGLNLLQYCPEELLFQKYNLLPQLFQQGINQAASEIKSVLSSLYDISKVLSNKNQWLKSQQGSKTISIQAGVYLSQLFISKPDIIFANPVVTIGTTDSGSDILDKEEITDLGVQLFINRYFAQAATLYLVIEDSPVNIEVVANQKASTNYQSIDAVMTGDLIKDDLLIKILSIFSIRNILGSSAATNKQLQQLFDDADYTAEQIITKQRSLPLPSANAPSLALSRTVESSFKTLG